MVLGDRGEAGVREVPHSGLNSRTACWEGLAPDRPRQVFGARPSVCPSPAPSWRGGISDGEPSWMPVSVSLSEPGAATEQAGERGR